MPVMTQEEALAEFRERMIGQHSGDTRVVDVRYEYPFNEQGEEYLWAELVLADPPPGAATWPGDEVTDLQLRGEDEAAQLGVAPPYIVMFGSLPRPDEDDEEADR